MNRGREVFFVIGFVCGVVALVAGLAVAPAGWPRPAGAAPAVRNAPTADQIAEAVVRAVEKRDTPCSDAPNNALQSDLQTLRSQIELYKIQHGDRRPGMDAQGRFDGEVLAAQLAFRTDEQGNVYTGQGDKDAYPFGPYLVQMPSNPFLPGPAAHQVVGGRGAPPRDGKSGWWVDTDSGAFSANHPERSGS